MSTDTEDLRRIISELRSAIVVPQDRRLWGMGEIADYSGYSVSTVQQRIACLPSFPEAIRALDNAQPRWVAAEVMEWFESRRKRRAA
jgi:predicted DNA-binding transcriptional regulator AlpA